MQTDVLDKAYILSDAIKDLDIYKELIDLNNETKSETIEKTETPKEEKVIKEEISGVKENLALTIKKENPWYKKIFDAIKRFLFGKNK